MTNKQTHGPWYKSTSENGLAVICHRNSDGDERVIARMSSRKEIGDEVPDADLIAAAPELLEQLKDSMDALARVQDDPFNIDLDAVSMEIHLTKQVITKATGEAQ